MQNFTKVLLAFCLIMATAAFQPAVTVDAQSSSCPVNGCQVYIPLVSNGVQTTQPLSLCLVTDTGGIDDGSFNDSTWQGILDAKSDFGASVNYLESQTTEDYQANIESFIAQGCDLIVTVGFMLGDATYSAALAHPTQKFTIVDFTYDPIVNNISGQSFSVDQPAFLSGYLAASMTKTGKVGTFGGFPIPTVTIFMDGFARGVAYYNQQKGTHIEVLGWDINDTSRGLFSSSFNDQAKGKELGNGLMDEGADIIMPVAGSTGLGTALAVKEHGDAYIIGVDSDWSLTNPDYANIVLTSVMKTPRGTTYGVIENLYNHKFSGGEFLGTLANQGVGLGIIHSSVSQEFCNELELVTAKIISGEIVTKP